MHPPGPPPPRSVRSKKAYFFFVAAGVIAWIIQSDIELTGKIISVFYANFPTNIQPLASTHAATLIYFALTIPALMPLSIFIALEPFSKERFEYFLNGLGASKAKFIIQWHLLFSPIFLVFVAFFWFQLNDNPKHFLNQIFRPNQSSIDGAIIFFIFFPVISLLITWWPPMFLGTTLHVIRRMKFRINGKIK